MKLPRRTFLHLAAGAAALPVVSRVAWAQTYPARPVRIVVPFAAGGNVDLFARLIGQWLSERLRQPFVIENRPGAGTSVGTEAVVDMVHVPYRGAGPALTDLIAGQVHVYFTALPEAIEHIRVGKIRALAVRTAAQSEILPDTPTLSGVLPGFEASFWAGFGAPKSTPTEIVDNLNRAINAGLADPKIKSRLAELGGTVLPGSPADFGKLIADETEKWGKVVRAANIKPE
jgi:tripartite-type tricarboxylate transporter receptor subunit TctC